MKYFFKNSYPYFKRYMPVIVFTTLLGFFRMVILLVMPQIVSLLVDRVINPLLGAESRETQNWFGLLLDGIPADDYTRIFWTLAVVLLGFAVLFFICFYFKWNLAHYFSLKSEKRMRLDALDKINRSSAPLLAKYSAGDLILITTKDPRNIRAMYMETVQFLLDNLFYIVFCMVFLCQIHYLLLFIPLVGGAVSAVIVALYQKRVGKLYDAVWRDSSALSTTVQESVYGVRTVASFAQEGERRRIFSRDNEKYRNTNIGGVKLFAMRSMYSTLVRAVVFVLSIALGIYLSLNGEITAGQFTATIGYVGTLIWQITGLLHGINHAQKNFVSGKRYFGFMNDRDEIAEKYGAEIPSETPSVAFKNVSVKSGEGYALKNVTLEIPYGKKVGVMGRTGSGKTLLVKLMQGLAEVDEGEIYLDGKPIHSYDRDELLRTYSYAMQNVFLFSNTIAANIALYQPFAEQEEIARAGALAEVDEFARRFPDGYQTTIGEKGFGLSGGQKQRISIARALFKNAHILVFDDVTSALDLDTERRVFQNLERECGDKTLVLVTHRATALKNCDEIIFLDKGQILERGSFSELMALGGDFAQIYNRQIQEVRYAE